MTGFAFLFCLLFRCGVLHGVLLVVVWCWVLYSGGFVCVSSHYLILPRVEKAMATHSGILAWKIPWTEDPGRLHGVLKSRTWLSDFTFTFHFHSLDKVMATHSTILAWRIPGTEEHGWLLFMGLHRVRHDWSDLAAAAAVLVLWWSSVLESVLPPQGLRAWPPVRSGDSTSGLLWR